MAKQSAVERYETLKAEFKANASKIKEEVLAELQEELKTAQTKVHDISAQISELTGKPILSDDAKSDRKRMSKNDKLVAVKKLYDAIGRTKVEAKSATELMQAIGLDKSAWQTISKDIIGLTKVGEKKDAKWFVKG